MKKIGTNDYVCVSLIQSVKDHRYKTHSFSCSKNIDHRTRVKHNQQCASTMSVKVISLHKNSVKYKTWTIELFTTAQVVINCKPNSISNNTC